MLETVLRAAYKLVYKLGARADSEASMQPVARLLVATADGGRLRAP